MKKYLHLLFSLLLASCLGLAEPSFGADSAKRAPKPNAAVATILWEQPVLYTDRTHAGINQDFEDALNDLDAFVADDFLIEDQTWSIRKIYLSTLLWKANMASPVPSLTNAKFLHLEIYLSDVNADVPVPVGDPVWSLALAPNDPQVVLDEYQTVTGYMAADVTISLSQPLTLPSGSYWLVYYVSMDAGMGRVGWRPSDSQNDNVAKSKGFGQGNQWLDWLLFAPYDYNDAAFRFDGFVIYRDDFVGLKAVRTPKTAELSLLPVSLKDAFETRTYHAKKQTSLLAASAKIVNGEVMTIANSDLHFVSYSLSSVAKSCVETAPEHASAACSTDLDCGGLPKGKEFCKKTPAHTPQKNIQINNQFGATLLSTLKADSLLVPSIIEPDVELVTTNHYKCYKAKEINPVSKGSTVVTDELSDEIKAFDIKKAYSLCTPVEKTYDGVVSDIIDPANSYVCYTAALSKKACTSDADIPYVTCGSEADCGGVKKETEYCQKQLPFTKRRIATVDNQFGMQSIDTVKAVNLCVPSTFTSAP